MVACAVTCAVGCGSRVPTPGSAYGPATADAGGIRSPGTGPPAAAPASGAPAVTVPSRAPWPERRILPEDARLLDASQVLDPAAGVLYALVPATLTSGPYSLQAIDLRTGRVRRGGSYPVSGLALASGHLWVYGSSGRGGHVVLDEADPETLATVRSVSVPGASDVAGVTVGPAGSVWLGAGRTLLRVSDSSGAVLGRTVLPNGLDLTDLETGPGGQNLYASAARLLLPGGAVVLEYSAATGRLLAHDGRAPLTWSVGGAWLTAVPGGVWVSFRTGMLGESGLLSARSLSVINGFPTVVSAADSQVTGSGTVYSWASGSPSAYGGGALWVVTAGGLVACINPVTGAVRAQETVTSRTALLVFGLAADPEVRELAAVISTAGYTGVVTISAPRACWN
jgi:hypothetical protein